MSVYVVAQIDITDRERYAQYEAGFVDIFTKHNGEVLAVDDEAEAIEGEKTYTRCVILRFPSRDDLMHWYRSDEYQELAVDRWEASTSHIALVKGFGT